MNEINRQLIDLNGIGPKKAQAFNRLGLTTVYDLINYFPRRYEDRTQFKSISEIADGETICVQAVIADEPKLSRIRRGLDLLKFRIADETGFINVTYFNQSYLKSQFHKGDSFNFYGKVSVSRNSKALTNPAFDKENSSGSKSTGIIVPVYGSTKGLTQKSIKDAVQQSLEVCGALEEPLPASVLLKSDLLGINESYKEVHIPSDLEMLSKARSRLIFQEFFVLATAMSLFKKNNKIKRGQTINSEYIDQFYRILPFEPTGAQKRAIAQSLSDMSSGMAMNRLVQGDVGSGKTLVASGLIWCTWKSGFSSAFMAPTEILAEQHYETLSKTFSAQGMRILLLKGSMTAAEKKEVKQLLSNGSYDLVIGTHALLSKDVSLNNLALVITDEQHRFGVDQRSSLIKKGGNPHVLVMSATPIPRTLALIVYGDLDISVIDELPPGRKLIKTYCVNSSYRDRLNQFIRKTVLSGNQVYVVCPMIEENDEVNYTSVEEHFKSLQSALPDLKIECLHGKIKAKEKEAIMNDFYTGRIDVLVSTTVIEVGVNVPNATLMIIENADRFGLSQLHQLRGRIGRGADQSYCVLVCDSETSDAKKRMEIMTTTSDGFKVSEQDLAMRGPGDFFGSKQHGLPKMHIADICDDLSLLTQAQEASKELLAYDPDLVLPEHEPLHKEIALMFSHYDGTIN